MKLPLLTLGTLLLMLPTPAPTTLSTAATEIDYAGRHADLSEMVETGRLDAAVAATERFLRELEQADSLYLYLELAKSMGTQLRKAGAPELAATIFQHAMPDRLKRAPAEARDSTKAAWLYVQVGFNAYHQLGDFPAARHAYELALAHLPPGLRNSNNAARYIFKELGNIYTRLGDFSAGETIIKEYIAVMEHTQQYQLAARGYNDLGLLYASWSRQADAERAYRAGLRLPASDPDLRAMLLLNSSDVLLQRDSFSAAERRLDEAERLLTSGDPTAAVGMTLLYLSSIYQKRAIILAQSEEYDQALVMLEREYEALEHYFPSVQRREFGKHHVQKGLVCLEMDDYSAALAEFQRALQAVMYAYAPTGPHDLPDAADCYAENTIMEALDGMAQTYQAWYAANDETAHLERALECYELMYAVERALRRGYLYNTSKLFNLEESRAQSEKAIAIAYRLYQRNGDAGLLYRAFVYAERNRGSLLREAFRADQAAARAGLTAEELAEEAALQRHVSQAEETLFRLRGEAAADTLIRQAERELLAARDAMRTWIEEIETANPRYYQFKYADAVPTLDQLQSILTGDEVLLEYFVGAEKLYVFRLDARDISLRELPNPARLTERILTWRAAIEYYQLPGQDRDRLGADYRREGYQLYRELVEPLLPEIAGRTLLLVTSGMLDLLPFEALLTQPVEAGTSFGAYPYLLHDFPVSYTYSASLQWSLHQLERRPGAHGGFAPAFDGAHGWPELSCSAELLSTTIGEADDLFLDRDATVANLRTHAARFRLLHLATHAQANAEQGDFSFIVFSDGRGGYDSLFAKDLYLYDLDTELVILGACETALGTLYNSEGVISLARAFHYAGARAVVNTLWRINENANCHLLEGFYAALDAGQDKRAALRAAKLAYLENADPRSAHPVYWAGFQLLGNPRPLEGGMPWYVWVLGGVLLLAGVGVAVRKVG